jgi:hypothetical protein
MRVRHAGEGGEPHSDCSFRRHRRVFTPSTPLVVGGLRVRRVCEGGKPNQTAHSVATDAPHRLHTSCTPRRLHTSCAPHRLHAVDSTGRRRPARAQRLLRDPPSTHRRLHCPSASCACAAPLARPTVFTPSTPLAVGVLRVRRACSLMQVSWPRPVCTRTKHPNRLPAPSRLSPTELSSKCPRSHSPLPARTAASKTSLTARARSLVAARPRRHKAASSRPAASTVLRARSRSTVLTPSTPMAVGVLRLHQRHALAR